MYLYCDTSKSCFCCPGEALTKMQTWTVASLLCSLWRAFQLSAIHGNTTVFLMGNAFSNMIFSEEFLAVS